MPLTSASSVDASEITTRAPVSRAPPFERFNVRALPTSVTISSGATMTKLSGAQHTVTLIRSAIRGLLAVCDQDLQAWLRGLLVRDDDYVSAGKPVCDWEDREAREGLIDALAKDARALLCALDGRELSDVVSEAMVLLAAVVGQDLETGEDGVFRIARRVAKDRSSRPSTPTHGTVIRPAPAGRSYRCQVRRRCCWRRTRRSGWW